MRQAQLSNTKSARYDKDIDCYIISERVYGTASPYWVSLNQAEVSNLIDFVMETTKKKLAFYCHRCQPNQRFDNLKRLVDHSEQAHLVHLVDLQRRLQNEVR